MIIRNLISIVAYSAFILMSTLFCSQGKAAPIIFKDDTGTEIVLQKPAERIIALYGAFNDMMLEMGLKNRIIARTKADIRPELHDLPVIGTHMRPNFEIIAALHPDLVLQFEGRREAEEQVRRLRLLGLNVAVFHGANFKDMFRIMKNIGFLAGEEAKAETCIASMQQRLEVVARKRTGKRKPRIFFEIRFPNLLAAGNTSMATSIIEAAGAINALSVPERIARISEEELIRLDPDAYLLQKGPMNTSPVPPGDRTHYRLLKAVKTNRVLIVDESMFSRPAPAAIQAVEELADWLDSVFPTRPSAQ